MAIKMVLFDLDGTLLPMDMDEFTMGRLRDEIPGQGNLARRKCYGPE